MTAADTDERRGGVWEPWTPEVGQRVRARVSGECLLHEQSDARVLDGLVGVVFDDLRDPRMYYVVTDPEGYQAVLDAGHWWCVDFRQSGGAITPAGKLVNADYYCAAELEPLDATEPRR